MRNKPQIIQTSLQKSFGHIKVKRIQPEMFNIIMDLILVQKKQFGKKSGSEAELLAYEMPVCKIIEGNSLMGCYMMTVSRKKFNESKFIDQHQPKRQGRIINETRRSAARDRARW